MDCPLGLLAHHGNNFVELGEPRIARLPSDIPRVNLLDDDGDFEQAEHVVEQRIGNGSASRRFVALNELPPSETTRQRGWPQSHPAQRLWIVRLNPISKRRTQVQQ